jgi:hypothetical protein
MTQPDPRSPPRRFRQKKWITRALPKIDRIACPWLVRRFIDVRLDLAPQSPGLLAVSLGLSAISRMTALCWNRP